MSSVRVPRHFAVVSLLALVALISVFPTSRASAASPWWQITTGSEPTNLSPGGSGTLVLTVVNLGDATASGAMTPIVVTDVLPADVTATRVRAYAGARAHQEANATGNVPCALESHFVSCSFTGELPPYEAIEVIAEAGISSNLSEAVPAGRVSVSGGNATGVSEPQPFRISEAQTEFGIHAYSVRAEEEGGAVDVQAGSHPFQLTTTIQLNEGPRTTNAAGKEFEEAPALPRNFRFELPAGFVGNATAPLQRCDLNTFIGNTSEPNECPPSAAIGVASVRIIEPNFLGFGQLAVPVFNLPPAPDEPARFGFYAFGTPVLLDTAVRGSEAYRVTVSVKNTPQLATLTSSTVTLWGAPGDTRHDNSRGWSCAYHFLSVGICSRPEGLANTAFLRLPTSCGSSPSFPMQMEPWNTPHGATISEASSSIAPMEGCNGEPFEPEIAIEPGTSEGESASGLAVHLRVPQEASEAPGGVAESDVRNTKVTLPPGLHINPAAANGLQACSEAQIGFKRMEGEEAVFNEDPAACPEASKLGKVKITTPLLEEPVTGWVYQAAQEANPFHSLLALYVVAEAPKSGIHVKLAGKVETDKRTGQVVSTFDETPQLPFEEFELTIFGGGTAPLATSTCGAYKTTTQIEPWSGGAAATPSSEFQVSGCANPQRFGPSFAAGTEAPLAGAYTPFVLNLRREDGEGQISRIDTVLPKGLTGKLAGVPYCPESSIHQAEARSNPGEGAAELASPSCPAASKVGSVRVGSGVGPQPYFVDGSVYLAGPYKGAPLSLVIVTPAVAGPFDLGTVVVRTALYVDAETARITAKSDPLPTMLQGIPLDVRSIALRMDRPDFTLNPTSCEAMSLGGTATSTAGQAAALSNHFQVGGCKGLDFKPRLKLRLKGATKRTGHPALRAVVTARHGEANIGRAQVNLPHGEFLDQGNIDKACTKPVLLAGNCPKRSVYGHAKAWTPLLAKPLRGPVYLVGGYGYKLPALVAELNGQIRILLVGKVDSGKNKGIRSTFETVPDAPVSRFELRMKGGKKYGLLENSENLCRAKKSKRRAIARFTGHNGKVEHFKPVVANQCGKHKRHKKRNTSHARAVRQTAAAHRRPGRAR